MRFTKEDKDVEGVGFAFGWNKYNYCQHSIFLMFWRYAFTLQFGKEE